MRPRLNTLCLAVCAMVVLSSPLGAALATAGDRARDALQRPALQAVSPQGAVMIGAAQAGARIVAVGERGLVILSDDDGATWRQARTPVSVTLTAVRFADAQHGFAVGHGGVVLTSNDGGESWHLQLEGRRAAQLALEAAEAAGDDALITSARMLVEEGPDKPFLDLLVRTRDEVWVVGAYGLAFRTTDGGQRWTSLMGGLDNPEGLHLNVVRERGERIVIAGERGVVLYSTDGGQRFARLDTPYDGSFFTAELPAEGLIVLAGLRGHLVHSADDGVRWQMTQSPVGASFTASAALADERVLLADQAGQVLAWSAAGALAPIAQGTLPALNGLARGKDDTLLLLSDLGVTAVDFESLTKETTR